MLKDKMISNEELSDITGGAATPGAVMVCTMAAPLYKSNPVGGQSQQPPLQVVVCK